MSVLPKPGPWRRRRAGVLLHVTSLPSSTVAGDLGPAAYAFVDFLAAAGCTRLAGAAAGADARRRPLAVQRDLGDGRQPRADQRRLAGRPGPARRRASWPRSPPAADPAPRRAPRGDAWLAEAATATASGATTSWRWRASDQATGSGTTPSSSRCARLAGRRRWTEWEPALRDRDPDALDGRWRRCGPAARLRSSSASSTASGPPCATYAARARACCSSATCRSSSRTTAPTCGPHRDLFDLDDDGRPTTVTGVPAGLLRGRRPALEQPALRLGAHGARRLRLVAAPGRRGSASCSTSCASTTSAGSRPPGTSRPTPPTAVNGSWVKSPGPRGPRRAGRRGRRGHPGRRGPRHDHRPRSTRCARSSACRA